MMAKIIFLDIDGVLTSRKSLQKFGNFRTFLPSSVLAFNFLLKATDAKIVISSQYRVGRSLEVIADYFNKQGIDGSKIIGKTPHTLLGIRGIEINFWLMDCKLFIDSFVVLDDEKSGLDRYLHRLVKTTLETGMDMTHAKAAMKMLNERDSKTSSTK